MFLELIEKMENWGEDWIWHVRIFSTCWINCQNLFHFSRIPTFNEKWKIVDNVGYVKLGCITYAGYELLNYFDFRMHSKHGNRDKQIYCIYMLDCWNCTL